jgi:hypothetical protein
MSSLHSSRASKLHFVFGFCVGVGGWRGWWPLFTRRGGELCVTLQGLPAYTQVWYTNCQDLDSAKLGEEAKVSSPGSRASRSGVRGPREEDPGWRKLHALVLHAACGR